MKKVGIEVETQAKRNARAGLGSEISFDGVQLVDRPWFPYLCTEAEHWRWETRDAGHFNFWVALAGTGYLSCEGQMYPIRPGSFFVFSPQQEITAAHYSGPRITRFSAHFLPLQNGKTVQSIVGFPRLGGRIRSLSLLQRKIDVIMRVAMRRDEEELLSEKVYQLIEQICLEGALREDAALDERVARAIQIFRENPASVVSMTRLASSLGISRSHFDRLFSKQVGVAPQKFLLNCKMIAAKRLLESSSLRVGEIGEMLGYSDIYFFSRQFKEQCGSSPQNYRSALVSV